MKNHFLHLIIALCASVILASCTEDDPSVDFTSKKLQITKITANGNSDVTTFAYNSDNRLETYERNITENTSVNKDILKFVYNNNGTLNKYIQTNEYGEKEINFTYKQDTIIAKNSSLIDSIFLNKSGFMVKLLTSSKYYYGYIYKKNYEYDEKGNLIREKIVAGSSTEESLYEYDTKNNVLLNQGLPNWFWIYYNNTIVKASGPNNMVKAIRQSETITISLEYNDSGYPVRIISPILNEIKLEYREIK